MKKLLTTTLVILPLTMGTAFAQDDTLEQPDQPAVEDTTTDTLQAPVLDNDNDNAVTTDDLTTDELADDPAVIEETVQIDNDKVVREQSPSELRLKWLNGATVTAPDGERIGSIDDLILDNESGEMVAAVIGVGGFLGIGEKKVAVPWERLTIDYDANEITGELSREEADAAPEYSFRDRESAPAPEAPAGDMGGMDPAPIQ